MSADNQGDPTGAVVKRASDRELKVTRTVNGPPRLVFDAFAKPELFQKWWVPKSFGITLISYEADIRTGGTYRLEMGHPDFDKPMAFFGRYIEVTPPARMVWTNDEAGDNGQVTTVTFEDQGEATVVVVSELYPSKEALDEAMANGSTGAWDEQFTELDSLLGSLDTKA